MWRIVLAEPQIATLSEIERHWCLADIVRANHMLSLRDAAQEDAEESSTQP